MESPNLTLASDMYHDLIRYTVAVIDFIVLSQCVDGHLSVCLPLQQVMIRNTVI